MSEHLEEEIEYDETDGNTAKKLDKLKKELAVCKEERQTYLDGWQRTKADFVNLKKRSAEDALLFKDRHIEAFIESLLPTLDSFDMAFKDKAAWEQAPEQWRKGIEYIYSQLQTMLSTYNVEKIGSVGEVFDHKHHEPIESVAVDKKKDNTVVEVIRSGYKIGNAVIRPAHVKVGHFEE
jgi:molecular chaperone GrpE